MNREDQLRLGMIYGLQRLGHLRRAWLTQPACLRLLALMLGITLTGCAGLPPLTRASPDAVAVVPRTDSGLGALAAAALAHAQPPGSTGALSLAHPVLALDTRLTLIAQAREAIDLQTFVLADDGTGRQLLRALRDAAARGVRVRVLVDDFHLAGMDPLLRGFAAHPKVELRLYNPFVAGRGGGALRWLALAGDFQRLNRRMHNKLFIVDGAMAIIGGRNIADGYFQRDPAANFIDFDLLALGALVPQLSALFDRYWSAAPVRTLAEVDGGEPGAQETAARAKAFDAATRALPLAPPVGPGRLAVPTFASLLAEGLPGLIGAEAEAFADTPDKRIATGSGIEGTSTGFAIRQFYASREELMLFSPYFIPGESGMRGLQVARANGIAVRVITNALGASDEPLAALAYERYRVPLLKMGVELYELSSQQMQRDERQGGFFGRSRAQLHAKLAFIDRRSLILGSFNLDQRSATTNTELAVVLHSPALAQQVLAWFNSRERRDVRGSYQVQLRPDGGLRWVALLGDGRSETHDQEPEAQFWHRLGLWLQSLFVPESLL